MAAKPRTKAGKSAKVAQVMHEWGQGKLKSGGSGKPVKSQKQAVAIALSESGQSKRRSGAKRANSRDSRIASDLERRVEEGSSKARR